MSALSNILGYRFGNPEHLTLALTHKSMGSPHNERLEFLGDAILSLVMAKWLYTQYPKDNEGTLSALRAKLVNQQTLAEIATTLQLEKHLQTGPSCRTPYSPSMLANGLEAILGALYLDGGLPVCQEAIERWWEARLDHYTPDNLAKNYKSLLQEWCQSVKCALPTYTIIHTGGQAHAPHYTVRCALPGTEQHTEGQDATKQQAEQFAARAMLALIKESL